MPHLSPTRPDVLHLECKCTDPAHSIRFTFDDSDGDFPPSLDCYVFLADWRRWWQRIIPAFRYLVGKQADRYGYFGGWDMDDRDVPVLRGLLDKYEASRKAWHEANHRHFD